MTEYETATLAIQQASLSLQQASLETDRLGVWVSAAVGLVQSGLIAWGLWLMKKAASHRDNAHAETMLALQQQGEALRTLIERTARD